MAKPEILAYIYVGVSQLGLESISTSSSVCSSLSLGDKPSLPLYVDDSYNRVMVVYNSLTTLPTILAQDLSHSQQHLSSLIWLITAPNI
jgi:hypothetical protein